MVCERSRLCCELLGKHVKPLQAQVSSRVDALEVWLRPDLAGQVCRLLGAPVWDAPAVERVRGFLVICISATAEWLLPGVKSGQFGRSFGADEAAWATFLAEHLRPVLHEAALKAKLDTMQPYIDRFDELLETSGASSKTAKALQKLKDAGGHDVYVCIAKYAYMRSMVSAAQARRLCCAVWRPIACARSDHSAAGWTRLGCCCVLSW